MFQEFSEISTHFNETTETNTVSLDELFPTSEHRLYE
jgi:hypothetical protein